MAILRSKEIRQLKPDELTVKANELRETLMTERSKLTAVGAADNPGKLREIKRTIARIETIRRESK